MRINIVFEWSVGDEIDSKTKQKGRVEPFAADDSAWVDSSDPSLSVSAARPGMLFSNKCHPSRNEEK